MHHIYDWQEISDLYRDCLLIGNGASIAVHKKFSYHSLLEEAKKENLITANCTKLFEHFETSDFELILRFIWQAYNVNISLDIEDRTTRRTYLEVRSALIESVRSIHPTHETVQPHLRTIAAFSKRFKTIFSMNYDLILYWATLWSNASDVHGHFFKDCFDTKEFRNDWQEFRNPIRDQREVSLVFYPHGNLYLSKDILENEIKISSQGKYLLEEILAHWESGLRTPLFVSEGDTKQKTNSIRGSNYLNTVYREALKEKKESLVIYGWGVWETDSHILDALRHSHLKRIALSTSRDIQGQAYINRVTAIIREKIPTVESIHFYDRSSSGCWNNY